MKTKSLIILLAAIAISAVTTSQSRADVAFAVAKDPHNHKQVRHYSWSIGGNERSTYTRDADCIRLLKNKGYSDVARLVVRDNQLDSGVFVIVEANYRYGDKIHSTMGAGAGRTYDEALNNALYCLGTYDWTWNRKKHGFDVVKTLRF